MGLFTFQTPPAWSGSGQQLFTMNDLNDMIAWRIRVRDTSPIIKAEFFITTKTGTPGNLGLVLCADNEGAPNISGGVPVDIGGGSATLKLVAAGSVTASTTAPQTVQFTNSYTPTAGEYVWLVAYPAAATYDGSNSYTFREFLYLPGLLYGDERTGQSANAGTSWTVAGRMPVVSFLTTADAFIVTQAAAAGSAGTYTYDSADNPDEHGVAMSLPAGTGAKVHGVGVGVTYSSTNADADLKCYLDNTQQGSTRSVNTGNMRGAAVGMATDPIILPSPPILVTSAGTLRVALRGTHGTATLAIPYIDFGSQARRESALAFRDIWHCHANDGGSFTDVMDEALAMIPLAEFYDLGGGGNQFPQLVGGGPVRR